MAAWTFAPPDSLQQPQHKRDDGRRDNALKGQDDRVDAMDSEKRHGSTSADVRLDHAEMIPLRTA